MTDSEVNKILAEFMGTYETWFDTDEFGNKFLRIDEHTKERMNYYTKSLDALVPVWERLEYSMKSFVKNDFRITGVGYSWMIAVNHNNEKSDMTLQEAAAHATAKAILEMGK